MKIKLLNDAGYRSLEGVDFPVVVDGFRYEGAKHCAGVTGEELIKIGADIHDSHSYIDLAFLIGEECEIINE